MSTSKKKLTFENKEVEVQFEEQYVHPTANFTFLKDTNYKLKIDNVKEQDVDVEHTKDVTKKFPGKLVYRKENETTDKEAVVNCEVVYENGYFRDTFEVKSIDGKKLKSTGSFTVRTDFLFMNWWGWGISAGVLLLVAGAAWYWWSSSKQEEEEEV